MRLINITELQSQLSLSRATIWRKIKEPDFPQPVKIGSATRWRQADVDSYVANLTPAIAA